MGADSPVPSMLDDAISTKIPCPGLNYNLNKYVFNVLPL